MNSSRTLHSGPPADRAATASGDCRDGLAPPSTPRRDVGRRLACWALALVVVAPALHAGDLDALASAPKLKWKTRRFEAGAELLAAADVQGTPHLVYRQDGTADTLRHGWLDGRKRRTETIGQGRLHGLQADDLGTLHVLFERSSDGALMLARRPVDGEWSQTVVTLDADDDLGQPAFAIDGDGVAHVLLPWEQPFPQPYDLTHAVVDGGSVSTLVVSEAAYEDTWHLSVADTGAPVLLLRERVGGEQHTRVGTWDGEAWSLQTLPFGPGFPLESEVQPLLPAIVRDGTTWVVGTRAMAGTDDLVVVSRPDGGSWSEAALLVAGSVQPQFDWGQACATVTPDGTVHAITTRPPNGGDLVYTQRAGDVLVATDLITGDTLLGAPAPNKFTLSARSPTLVPGPGDCFTVGIDLGVSKGNLSGQAVAVGIFDGGTVVVGFRGFSQQSAPAVGGDGIVHVASVNWPHKPKLKLHTLTGTTLRVMARPKAGGTVAVEPTGLEAAPRLSHGFLPGTDVTLTATPAEGWTFKEWKRDAEGGDPTAVVDMSKRRRVIAVFEKAEG